VVPLHAVLAKRPSRGSLHGPSASPPGGSFTTDGPSLLGTPNTGAGSEGRGEAGKGVRSLPKLS
jgi:hypothetical protein